MYIFTSNKQVYTLEGVVQGRIKRWTSQLDLGNTTGGLETVVSVHCEQYITLVPHKSLMDHDSQKNISIIIFIYFLQYVREINSTSIKFQKQKC